MKTTRVRELAAREREQEIEAHERAVLRKHRKHLDRALSALVAAQARFPFAGAGQVPAIGKKPSNDLPSEN
jgi:hypothetical protein